MTWNFPEELRAAKMGLIDFHLYQTDHQAAMVGVELAKIPGYRPLRFTPYFDTAPFPFVEDRPTSHCNFGRISRADPGKFAPFTKALFESVRSGAILGWSKEIEQKVGAMPSHVLTMKPCAISQQLFYATVHVLVMATDTYENLPRVGMEAMSSGTVIVADKRGGWELLVDHGRTGLLCCDEKEFIGAMRYLTLDADMRRKMALAARARLESLYGMEVGKVSWGKVFEIISGRKPQEAAA